MLVPLCSHITVVWQSSSSSSRLVGGAASWWYVWAQLFLSCRAVRVGGPDERLREDESTHCFLATQERCSIVNFVERENISEWVHAYVKELAYYENIHSDVLCVCDEMWCNVMWCHAMSCDVMWYHVISDFIQYTFAISRGACHVLSNRGAPGDHLPCHPGLRGHAAHAAFWGACDCYSGSKRGRCCYRVSRTKIEMLVRRVQNVVKSPLTTALTTAFATSAVAAFMLSPLPSVSPLLSPSDERWGCGMAAPGQRVQLPAHEVRQPPRTTAAGQNAL